MRSCNQRNSGKKRLLPGIFFALLSLLLVLPLQAQAISIGTFNIEYFNVSGKRAYSPEDCKALAERIRNSGAEVLALQEIEGNATMRFFVTKFLPGWKYAGNDTGGRQDLYFLWKNSIKLLDGPTAYGANASFRFEGKSYKLHDRPILVGKFSDPRSGRVFTLVNVHLKSQSTRGKEDQERAERYNNAKRAEQIAWINKLVASLSGPVFILGDYNVENPQGTDFPLLGLPRGKQSYDNTRSNLDYIGYTGISKGPSWKIYEVESAIQARSTRNSQHPDHDMVILSLDGQGIVSGKGGTASPQVSLPPKMPTGGEDRIVYVTKTGKKYHEEGCSSLSKSKIPISLKEAIGKGYIPCKRCH